MPFACATAAMRVSGSTARTSAPRSIICIEAIPVPAPASRIRQRAGGQHVVDQLIGIARSMGVVVVRRAAK
jgi:hypothetical protein